MIQHIAYNVISNFLNIKILYQLINKKKNVDLSIIGRLISDS